MNQTSDINIETEQLLEAIVTEDGSSSLYLPSIDEHYHSVHGAVQESTHVFIDAGLSQRSDTSSLRVFEVGFGTGLNAYLTLHYSLSHSLRIDYHTIERFPLSLDTVATLNYTSEDDESIKQLFQKMHETPWDERTILSENFVLHKIKGDFIQCNTLPDAVDVVYFDAFSPEKQPEMWQEDLLKRLYEIMSLGGVMTTYCAKGAVRRAMQAAGFKVERIPGPPGKREMLRATKV